MLRLLVGRAATQFSALRDPILWTNCPSLMYGVCVLSLHPTTKILSLACLLALFLPTSAGAVELRDAELVAGGLSVLQNGGGTVRLEDGRLGTLPVPVAVPEPGVLWQAVTALGVLAFLRSRRRFFPDAS